MSIENVKLFYQALAEDRILRDKFEDLSRKYDGQKLIESQNNLILQQELIPLAKESGYDFTLDDLKDYANNTEKTTSRELTEDELAAVTGGIGISDTNSSVCTESYIVCDNFAGSVPTLF